MSKAVMISIKPQWCELIAKKQKTIEVRKTRPKIKLPFKCYIYMIKSNLTGDRKAYKDRMAGKVIGEFICDDISTNYVRYDPQKDEYGYWTLLDDSCLTKNQLMEYGKCHILYGWHISDLVIYDKPKEISEFRKATKKCFYDDLGCAIPNCDDCTECNITKPPRSWCYVEVENV